MQSFAPVTRVSIRFSRYLCLLNNGLMEQSSNYLFVYGTLLGDGNEFAFYLTTNCKFQQKGRFKGNLYDAGEYPAAIADSHSTNYVYGSIFLMPADEAILKYLDDYEGFGSGQAQPNLFMREMVEVETADGPFSCWMYLYNLPVDGLRLIGSGDYLAYKNA